MSAQSRRRTLRAVAPVAGLLAAGLLVWQGSYAAFSATTDNQNNSWAAGNLTLQNNGGQTGFASTTTPGLFGEPGLRPGASGKKCLTVEKDGTVAGSDLRFYVSNIADSTPSMGSKLMLTIDAAPVLPATNVQSACSNFPTTGVTNVATNVGLTSLPTSFDAATTNATLGTGTQRVAYRFAWTFDSSADNTLLGKTVTANFNFEAQ